MYYSSVLSILRLIFFIIWTFLCSFFQLFILLLHKDYLFIVPRFCFKGLVFIFGIKVNHKGIPNNKKTVYVSNHTSYLDILILGSKIDGLFVAKSEIETWPLINKISKLRKTIFVNRGKKSEVNTQVKRLSNTLKDGYNIILFPEGTSNDGHRVLPFKSSLFAITDDPDIQDFYIQPISISYTGLDGLPLNRMFKPFFAWYGNMDLLPHVWQFLGLGSCEITINYHKPILFSQFSSRKLFCDHCFKIISRQVSSNLSLDRKERIDNLYSYKHL